MQRVFTQCFAEIFSVNVGTRARARAQVCVHEFSHLAMFSREMPKAPVIIPGNSDDDDVASS